MTNKLKLKGDYYTGVLKTTLSETLLSDKFKLLYIATPKAACTTVKWWFAKLLGVDNLIRDNIFSAESDQELKIHDTLPKLFPQYSNIGENILKDVLDNPNYLAFSFVRNPYSRIFSAWQSKLLLREPLQFCKYSSFPFTELPYTKASEVAFAFEQFLEHINEFESQEFCDVHWTPQFQHLMVGSLQNIKVSKLEFPQDLLERLSRHLPSGIHSPLACKSINESLIPYSKNLLTKRSVELIRKIYAEDFHHFKYNEVPPSGQELPDPSIVANAAKAISMIRSRNLRLMEIKSYMHDSHGERNLQLAELSRRIANYKIQAGALHGELADKQGQIDQRGHDLDRLRANLYLVKSSWSWRLIATLKVIQEKMKFPVQLLKQHITFSWKEGRLTQAITGRKASINNITAWVNHYRPQLVHLDKTKKTVLLVTHEISRTGAPILVLNLAEKLKQYYTVIILSMGGGSLLEEFTKACDLFIGPLMNEQSMPDFLCGFLKGVMDLHPIDCALVNCIVSTPILRPLWKNNIPASHLIHEFSSYTRPETTFNESGFFAAKQVFSSKLVLENALSDYPNLANKSPLIMPQGRCLPPIKLHGCDKGVEERSRIDSFLRPPGSPENLFVVIGLGTVQLRKGVDLFLECAHKVSKMKSKVPIRFVWFGHGYNVKLDGDYSVYLHDQIKRSGIEQMCAITHETDQLDHVYETADLLFLSSRLDPLPLVSQDMMAHGKPVLCFEKATGLAEFLIEEPTVGSCVIDYMDVDGAASRIVELANDHSEYQRVGKAFEAVIGKTFNLDRYAEKIHEHCEELIAMEEAEKEDHEIIKKSGLLDDKFFRHHAAIDQYSIKAYMSLWSMGLDHRKPFPGFHPGIYAERNQISQGDPFAEYIRQGKPAGPWIQEVITPGDVTDEDLRKALVPTALHLHLYYTEMADAILASIARCKSRPDLLISVGDQVSRKEVEEALLKHGLEAKRIAIVPNRGRDIGPFLTEFGKEITDNYEIVGHLHSKNTLAIEDRGFVRNWKNFLYGNLLGEQAPMMDIILKKMGENPTIGLIYPDDPFVVGWGDNRTFAEKLLERMKISGGELHENINFPVGTMFWARTKALKPLFDLNLDWGDYHREPLPYDGSMLHAIERMLTIIAEQQNFKTAVTNNPKLTR